MKKSFWLFSLIIVSLLSNSIHASTLCKNEELGKLPLQTGGRVKPLRIHAKESIKFITGKSSWNKIPADELYCLISLGKLNTMKEFPVRIDHSETKKFLGIPEDQKFISPEFAFKNFQKIQTQANVFKSRGDKTPPANDMQKLAMRIDLLQAINMGADWSIPFNLNLNKDHSGQQNPTFENTQWLFVSDLNQIFPKEMLTNDKLVEIALTAGKKYTETINDHHILEYKYDVYNPFSWAMLAVLFALFFVSIGKRHLTPLGITFLVLVFALEISAVFFRVSISGRAPVTNMYETVMWVGMGALFFSVILTIFRKRKIFILSGLGMNLACLFMMTFANNMLDSSIQPLVPVLRDNFWLSTHVTLITISYAALALSWVISNVFMIKSIIRSVDQKERRDLNKFAYDCLKIGVVLLALGIILGGVWADYSWGRFWGWDPKETWSLIALLTYMAILHGRFSGWITPIKFLPSVGMAFLTVIMAWFGVNYILATGLHSYGFSTGGAIFIGSITLIQVSIFSLFVLKVQVGNKKNA